MLEDELRDLLRELCVASGALGAAIHAAEAEPSPRGRFATRAPVGGGRALIAWFEVAEQPPDATERAAALERTARAVRACLRRWEVDEAPEVSFPDRGRTTARHAMARIHAYLEALVGSLGMRAVVVARKVAIVATAGELGELERERVPFTVRRVQVEVDRQRGKSSHAELAGDDFYAVAFWYDACLVCYLAGPYSIDFVRHRCRLVAKELVPLLEMIDDDPELDPIKVQPVPES